MRWIKDHGGDVSAYDGMVKEYEEPLSDGSYYQWSSLSIDTLEGRMSAKIGDWIVRGVEGEFYPVKPSVFAATYEAVEQ